MQKALRNIDTQLNRVEVELTLTVLSRASAYNKGLKLILYSGTGFEETKKKVDEYMVLLHRFPINAILTAADIDSLGDAICKVFDHFQKKITKDGGYPINRAFNLVQAISRDVAAQTVKVCSLPFYKSPSLPSICLTLVLPIS